MQESPRVAWHSFVFVFALFMLLGLAWQARNLQQALVSANDSVLHSLEVMAAATDTFSLLQDVESGERGFVITGVDDYLAPYNAARERLAVQRVQLAEAMFINGPPPRSDWLSELDRLIEQRLSISAANIQTRQEQGLEAASQRLLGAGGRQTMEALRALFDELRRHEVALLAEDHQQLDAQVARGHLFAVVGGILVLLLLGLAFASVVRSMSLRQRLAYRAQASAARLEALFSAMPDDLYEIDPNGRIRSLTRDELQTPVPGHFTKALLERLPDADEIRQFNWEDGRGHTYEIRLAPTGLGDHLAIARDVTEVLRAERMKTEFISTVSHELRTPLTAIRGALGMLANGMLGDVPSTQRPLLDIAFKNSERLVQLINDILDIEKLEAGHLPLHLALHMPVTLVEQAMEYNLPYAQQYGVELRLADRVDGVSVRVDAERFAQIMANLLSNAIKHSYQGGVVEIGLRRENTWIEFSVSDTGRGIPEDFQPRVFERFAQADSSDVRRLGGTGLGLAITRSLVEQMGGEIGFQSQVGVGTRFYVRLPAVHAPAPSIAPPSPEPFRGDRCILVLEPHAEAAKQLTQLLEQQGYTTRTAVDAAAARQLLTQGVFHALTLSPALRDEDCIAFIQALRDQPNLRHLPVLVVNLQGDPLPGEVSLRGGAVGVMDWLHKPIDPSRVLEVVSACMRHSRTRPCILHVEDDDDLRSLMASLLAPLEIDLIGAGSLAEARQHLRSRRHDLAILDLMLPDGDGSELIDELAQSSPPTPVIIFSALDATDTETSRVHRRLVKSRHDSAELARLIQNMLQHWPSAGRDSQDKEIS